MCEQEKIFEQAELKLSNLKRMLTIGDLQFERIKSTINKSSIWDKEIDNAIVDFIDEFDEDEQEEMKFRYEAAKSANASAQALWNQLNKCIGFELSKENMILILSAFIESAEVFANQFNNHEDTEVLINLRKTLEDISLLV